MTKLLSYPVFGPRDDTLLLQDLNEVTARHIAGCANYARVFPEFKQAATLEDLPFLHVGAFKHVLFKTEVEGLKHERTLKSSATTSGISSQVVLDTTSSKLQSESSSKIITDFVGDAQRPLVILDSAKSLRSRGEVSARIAAAMTLRPMASDMLFLLEEATDPASAKWDALAEVLDRSDEILVYGFTWILWLALGQAELPATIRKRLNGKTVHFVHSGGWKKLEAQRVDHTMFNQALLRGLHPASAVVDFYGLVEQPGIIFPECEKGYRHVPVWANVILREPGSFRPIDTGSGLLQFQNPFALGSSYHSVLTEDMGELVPGDCDCGRLGKRFLLHGRVPKAEVRGCANV